MRARDVLRVPGIHPRGRAGEPGVTPHERLRRFFAPGGRLSHALPGYEPRTEQAGMADDVLATFEEGGLLLVEAGTGVGKTLAYLVPALQQGLRLVVSTATKALQDQIALKDVPFLRDRCRFRFTACALKGRDNYLCKHRFASFRAQPTLLPPEEASAWPWVERWAEETETGDIAELHELPESPTFWSEVNAKDATCLGARCPQREECHLNVVRARARDADVVIVNHHLYLADAAMRASQFGRLLPDVTHAVFDEAHRLEAAATTFFGRTVSNWRLRELADDAVRELHRDGAANPAVAQRADELARTAADFVDAWGPEGRSVLPARLPAEQEDAMHRATAAVMALRDALRTLPEAPVAEPLLRRSTDLLADMSLILAHEEEGHVYWLEVRGRGAFLSATPVDIAPLMRANVFAPLSSAVLCSATLAVARSFEHVRTRLGLLDAPLASGAADAVEGEAVEDPGAPDAEDDAEPPALHVREAIHASPFDHEQQGLLYLPPEMPDPRDGGFAGACAAVMRQLLEASRGRAFLLFTSYENLRRVHLILKEDLPFPLRVQGEAPKMELLRRFREQEGSVLLATSSFWEGVDVPGPALSLVVIDKLPFGVPTDPIAAARSRLIEERGGSPFYELSLPEAVLALKQGVGRLIRSRSDRGVVALLDPRLATTRYGRAFLESLPPFRRTRDLDDVRAFFR
jgi:ATP-dependent DNA helicase DinG